MNIKFAVIFCGLNIHLLLDTGQTQAAHHAQRKLIHGVKRIFSARKYDRYSLKDVTDPPELMPAAVIAYPGPQKNENYDPNFGYEPYWADGNWVWDKIKHEAENGTLCGRVCLPLYKNYGALCGRDENFKYKNFSTYCDMKNEDCEDIHGWVVVYRGRCRTRDPTFPLLAYNIQNRVTNTHAVEFNAKYDIDRENDHLHIDWSKDAMRTPSFKIDYDNYIYKK